MYRVFFEDEIKDENIHLDSKIYCEHCEYCEYCEYCEQFQSWTFNMLALSGSHNIIGCGWIPYQLSTCLIMHSVQE